jgi:hypothetical protein
MYIAQSLEKEDKRNRQPHRREQPSRQTAKLYLATG